MTTITVSCVGHRSDRVDDLISGAVRPDGIDLQWFTLPPAEAFRRMQRGEFDIGEMSLATHIVRVSRGERAFVAIPAFPSRCFRHGAIYVGSRSEIHEPRDLIGCTVGVPEYHMTAALWVRGMLHDDHDIEPSSMKWVTGGLRDPGRRPLVEVSVPGVSILHVEDRSLDDMLMAGEIDAIVAPQAPPSFFDSRGTRQMFADPTSIEKEYFLRTRLFPIMHTVAISAAFHDAHPWAAVSLFRAFETARSRALERLRTREPLPVSLPWIQHAVDETIALMGQNFWPYGIESNRATLEAACRYAHDQGLSDRLVDPVELFAPTVVDLDSTGLL
ncbi:MAG: substrate-binding domain-containing protein [Ilumatobacteraceae bacterium]